MTAATDVTVASGTGYGVDLAAGEQIRISTPDGGQGGDFSFLGFDQALSRNINGWERFGRPWLIFSADPGTRLYDGEGEPVFEVGECTGDGRNDIMYPGCWSGQMAYVAALAGDLETARESVRLLLAAHPDASIALMQACHPTRNVPRIFGPMLEGWRLAGLPER